MLELEIEEMTRAGDKYRWYRPKERQPMAEVNALFVDLQDLEPGDPLTDGKPFDGLVAGTFTDMNGRKFEFTDEDLPEIVANTKRAIEATRSESGELAGLPIDAKGHEGGDGAGFIVGIELVDGVIRLTPQWTKIGVELIGEKIRRWFSATVDTLRDLVIGGTLTNWPATRDNKTGEILLRPIELANLSQPIYRADFQDEESLDEHVDNIQQAWWAQEELTDGPRSWVANGGVFEDHVIIDRSEGGFVRVPYSMTEDGEIEFADESEWTPVRRAWIDLIRSFMRSAFRLSSSTEEGTIEDENEPETDRQPDADRSSGSEPEEDPMTDKVAIADLSAEDQKIIIGGVVAELGLDPEAFRENGDLGESMAQLVDAAAEVKAKASLKTAERESEIAQLSKDFTGGTDELPVGIPVEVESLTEFLKGLTDDQREQAVEILSAIQEKGLTEFEEAGHGKRKEGSVELPEVIKEQLDNFLAGSDKATVGEFFSINEVELGAMADYDLSAYAKESNDG